MSNSTLYARARRLAGNSALVALSLSAAPGIAQAASLLNDYSTVGEYSNSGWFMSNFDDSAASATTQGLGQKLTGSKTVSDSMFWGWNDYYQQTLRRYDVTGFAFVWGGAIDGTLNEGDRISTAYDFTVDFTHTAPIYGGYDYSGAGWSLIVGLRSDPYIPEAWQSGPDSGYSVGSTVMYGGASTAGSHHVQGGLDITLEPWTAENATSWYAMLIFDWVDGNAWSGYEDTHGVMNGDTFSVNIPNQSIDVDLIPLATVPLPAGIWLLSSAFLGLVSVGRRKVS